MTTRLELRQLESITILVEHHEGLPKLVMHIAFPAIVPIEHELEDYVQRHCGVVVVVVVVVERGHGVAIVRGREYRGAAENVVAAVVAAVGRHGQPRRVGLKPTTKVSLMRLRFKVLNIQQQLLDFLRVCQLV